MNKSKTVNFLKKYGYWFALMLSVVVLAVIVTISASYKNTPMVNIPDDSENTVVNNTPIEFVAPVAAVSVSKDYSNSALQYSTTLKQWEAHKAIDFAATEGTEVYAVMDGTVTEVSYSYLMGNTVKLDVGNGLVVVYSSLANDVPVKVGDTVEKGSVIGKVSTTAKSEAKDGPHLHLETWLNEVNVDPNLYLDLGEK